MNDLVNNAAVLPVAGAAMRALNAIQDARPEHQILGAAALFVLLVERFNMSPQEIMTRVKNIMNYAEGKRPEFAAIADYMRYELKF